MLQEPYAEEKVKGISKRGDESLKKKINLVIMQMFSFLSPILWILSMNTCNLLVFIVSYIGYIIYTLYRAKGIWTPLDADVFLLKDFSSI